MRRYVGGVARVALARLGSLARLNSSARAGVRGRPRSRIQIVLLLLLAVLSPALSGCGVLSSRGLKAPGVMTVSSPVFSVDVSLPRRYTCYGAGLSPPLQWSGAPTQKARSFAIVVDDSDAPIRPYVYWIVFDVSRKTIAIPQGDLPRGAREGLNSGKRARYEPPCPAGADHRYRFTVYALNVATLSGPDGPLPAGAGLQRTWKAIAAHVIAVGRLSVSAKQ